MKKIITLLLISLALSGCFRKVVRNIPTANCNEIKSPVDTLRKFVYKQFKGREHYIYYINDTAISIVHDKIVYSKLKDVKLKRKSFSRYFIVAYMTSGYKNEQYAFRTHNKKLAINTYQALTCLSQSKK